MTTIINLTPHDITLRSPEGTDTVVPKSGTEARVPTTPGARNDLDGVPCAVFDADAIGDVTGLPAEAEGVLYLVSGLVGAALAGKRNDLLVPGTAPADNPIRNDKGWIVAVTRLKRV